jgi:hypothetical protein
VNQKPHRTCGALEEGHTGKDGNTINHTFRPALQTPPARKSATDTGNAKKPFFV